MWFSTNVAHFTKSYSKYTVRLTKEEKWDGRVASGWKKTNWYLGYVTGSCFVCSWVWVFVCLIVIFPSGASRVLISLSVSTMHGMLALWKSKKGKSMWFPSAKFTFYMVFITKRSLLSKSSALNCSYFILGRMEMREKSRAMLTE